MHSPRCFYALLLAGTLLTAACADSDKENPVKPTGPVSETVPAVHVTGSTLVTPHSVANPFCPSVPPFFAAFDLVVRARERDLVLEHVRAEFVDVFGTPGPPAMIPQPMVVPPFGSTTISAGSSRTFPMHVPFGCGTVASGTLTVVVVARDRFGSPSSSKVVLTVR